MQLKNEIFGLGLLSFGLVSHVAHAEENIVRDPDRHTHYVFEAEPHFLLAPIDGPAPGVRLSWHDRVGAGRLHRFDQRQRRTRVRR